MFRGTYIYPGTTWDGESCYETTNREEIEKIVEDWVKLAKERKTALWVGEFGCGVEGFNSSGFIYDFTKILDEKGLSYTYWTYCKGIHYCLREEDGKEKKDISRILSRTYILLGASQQTANYNPYTGYYKASFNHQHEIDVIVSSTFSRGFPSQFKASITDMNYMAYWYPHNNTLKYILQPGKSTLQINPLNENRTVGILSNSIDWEVTGKQLSKMLEEQGIKVNKVEPQQWSEGMKYKVIIVLGGYLAPDGVGSIVSGYLTSEEKKQIMNEPSIIVKRLKNQTVIIVAGRDRYLTGEALNIYRILGEIITSPK